MPEKKKFTDRIHAKGTEIAVLSSGDENALQLGAGASVQILLVRVIVTAFHKVKGAAEIKAKRGFCLFFYTISGFNVSFKIHVKIPFFFMRCCADFLKGR